MVAGATKSHTLMCEVKILFATPTFAAKNVDFWYLLASTEEVLAWTLSSSCNLNFLPHTLSLIFAQLFLFSCCFG